MNVLVCSLTKVGASHIITNENTCEFELNGRLLEERCAVDSGRESRLLVHLHGIGSVEEERNIQLIDCTYYLVLLCPFRAVQKVEKRRVGQVDRE